MEFLVMGPLEVHDRGQPLVVGAPRTRSVLALLLTPPNTLVSVDHLVDELWPEQPPRNARDLVHWYVSRLRRGLRGGAAADRLVTRKPGYLLRVAEPELDRGRYERLLATARAAADAGRLTESFAGYQRAGRLWRGSPYLGASATAQITAAATSLTELRLTSLEEQYAVALRLGGGADLVAELTELVTAHPLRERLVAHLMSALQRAGRAAEALAVFQQTQRELAEELGLDPGPELRQLQLTILRGDRPAAAPEPLRRPAAPASPAAARPAGPAVARPAGLAAAGPAGLAVARPAGLAAARPAGLAAARPAGPARVRPAQLPADLATFTGRGPELAELLAAGSGRSAAAAAPSAPAIRIIDGMAGVGKTVLAVHAAHRLADGYPDGQLFVDLHGFTDRVGPVDPADALDRMLRALGHPGDQVPAGLAERTTLYRSRLAGRRMLVLLDNAATEEQVQPLLPGTGSCLVLVTSRHRLTGLDGAQPLSLGLLRAGEAVRLFARVAGEQRLAGEPTGLVEQVVEQCGRLPLAIQIAAARLRARPGWNLAHLADRLQDEQHRLAELAAGPRSLAAAFGLSYQHLTPPQRRLFRLLGLVPGADIDRYAAAALADATLAHADRLLEDLVDAHLLEAPAPYRYRCHDLLRQYAARCARDEPLPERQAALTRLFDHYTYAARVAAGTCHPDPLPPVPRPATAVPRLDQPELATAWLDTERPNLLAVARSAAGHGWPRHPVWLSRILFHHLDWQARLADAEQLHSLARDAAGRTGDRTAQAHALRYLTRIDIRRGRVDSARARLGQALELYQQAGDQAGEAHTRYGLGVVETHADRYRPALAHYRQALAGYRRTGDLVSRARTLRSLSAVHARLGHHRHALAQLQQALAIHRRLADPDGEARARQGLGEVYRLMGRLELAGPELETALAIHRQTGNVGCQAAIMDSLGCLYRQLGAYDRALEQLRQALAVHRHSGARAGEAETLNNLGYALRAAGRARDALPYHQQALALAGRLGFRYEQARAHAGLGQAHQALGHRDRANQHRREALDRFTQLGVPEP